MSSLLRGSNFNSIHCNFNRQVQISHQFVFKLGARHYKWSVINKIGGITTVWWLKLWLLKVQKKLEVSAASNRLQSDWDTSSRASVRELSRSNLKRPLTNGGRVYFSNHAFIVARRLSGEDSHKQLLMMLLPPSPSRPPLVTVSFLWSKTTSTHTTVAIKEAGKVH